MKSQKSQSKILPRDQIWLKAQFCLARNLVGECLPQTLRVVASSVLLALPNLGRAHSFCAKTRLLLRETTETIVFVEGSRAARSNASFASFSSQSLWTLWGSLIKNANVSDLVHWHFYAQILSALVAFSQIQVLLRRKRILKDAQQSCHKFLAICAKRRNFKF